MRVNATVERFKIGINLDPKKWSEIYDTEGMVGSEVKQDLQEWIAETVQKMIEDHVRAEADKLGILLPNREEFERRDDD